MLISFLVCGSSFKVKDHEDEFSCSSPCKDQTSSTTKGTFKITSPCSKTSRKANKNPFSNRGLDKFAALLADVEKKKQKIYLSKNSKNISFVRFVYSSSSNEVVPIVVVKSTGKDKKNHTNKLLLLQEEPATMPISDVLVPSEPCLTAIEKIINLQTLKKQPYFNILAMTIFILLLLTVFGRSGAILFATIGWYLVPKIAGSDTILQAKTKQGKKKGINNVAIEGLKKKEMVRKLNEIQMVSHDHHESVSSPVKERPVKHDSGHRKSF